MTNASNPVAVNISTGALTYPAGGGTAGTADAVSSSELTAVDAAAVHIAGTETITGAKTFSTAPVVPTPSAAGHAVTKAYADALTLPGGSVADADATTKGILRLTGDFGGTATTPTVPGLTAKAPLASPTFTGTPAAPTAAADTTTTQVATTAYVVGQASAAAPLIAGTAAAGTSKKYSRDDHVHPTDTTRAPLVEGVSSSNGGSAYTIPANTVATIHEVILNSPSCALTFPTGTAGASFTLMLRQDATGGRAVTWPGTIVWIGTGSGAAPTLVTTAAKISLLSFTCVNTGYWIGTYAGSNA